MIGRGRVPEVLVGTWIVMALLLVFGAMARSALAAAADPTIPDEGVTLRSVAEVLVEWIDGFVAGVMETHGYRDLVPFLGSLFLFILAANIFGLIPGMEPPTSYSDLTFALGTVELRLLYLPGVQSERRSLPAQLSGAAAAARSADVADRVGR